MALIHDSDAPGVTSFEHLSTGRLAMIVLACVKVIADRLGKSPKETIEDLLEQAGVDD